MMSRQLFLVNDDSFLFLTVALMPAMRIRSSLLITLKINGLNLALKTYPMFSSTQMMAYHGDSSTKYFSK